MRKPIHFSITALLLGLVAAALRAVELKTVFDPVTGLAEPGAPVSVGLICLSVLAALLFVLFAAVFWRPPNIRIAESSAATTAKKGLRVAAALLLMAGGAIEFAFAPERTASRSIFAIFAIFAGVSMFALLLSSSGKRSAGEPSSTFSLVPVFFLCYWLIISYAERSADPVVLDYVYDLFALVAALLYLYYWAGFSFKNRHPRKAIFFGTLTVYFTALVTVSPFLARVWRHTGEFPPASRLLCFAAMGLFALGTLSDVARPRIETPPPREADGDE